MPCECIVVGAVVLVVTAAAAAKAAVFGVYGLN